MALIPRLSICTTGRCGIMTITETTGVATTPGDNSSMWGDTVTAADVVSASITIEYPNGTEDVYDVTSSIPNPVVGSFSFGSFSPVNGSYFVDGKYTITYTITTATETFTNDIITYLICQISCCVDSMFKTLPNKMCEMCDYDTYLANALKMEALLKALRSAINSGLIVTADALLVQLQGLCDWDECNCH